MRIGGARAVYVRAVADARTMDATVSSRTTVVGVGVFSPPQATYADKEAAHTRRGILLFAPASIPVAKDGAFASRSPGTNAMSDESTSSRAVHRFTGIVTVPMVHLQGVEVGAEEVQLLLAFSTATFSAGWECCLEYLNEAVHSLIGQPLPG